MDFMGPDTGHPGIHTCSMRAWVRRHCLDGSRRHLGGWVSVWARVAGRPGAAALGSLACAANRGLGGGDAVQLDAIGRRDNEQILDADVDTDNRMRGSQGHARAAPSRRTIT